jgi:hypothetical protein
MWPSRRNLSEAPAAPQRPTGSGSGPFPARHRGPGAANVRGLFKFAVRPGTAGDTRDGRAALYVSAGFRIAGDSASEALALGSTGASSFAVGWESRRRQSAAGRHAMSEPHPSGGQGAWEPAGHRPRTLGSRSRGCSRYQNKSGA